MAVKFANLASTTLASSLSNTATSISVTSSSSFPTLGSGDYFYASIGESTGSEIVKVTGVSSNTFTVVRGQDGTSAQNWSSGSSIALRVVAAALDDIAEQAQTAADTESVSISGDTMTGNLSFGDNDKAIFGAGSDLQIYHSGTGSYIEENGTGNLFIEATNLRIKSASGENYIAADQDGAVTLYNDNSAKLATTSTGIDVTGNATFDDNGRAIFGAGSDLQIYHDGSNSYIGEFGTGSLRIRSSQVRLEAPDSQNMVIVTEDQGVQAFYNGTQRFQVTNTGIDVTGLVQSDEALIAAGTGTDAIQTLRMGSGSGGANKASINFQNSASSEIFSLDFNNSTGTFDVSGDLGGLALSVTRAGDISFYEDTGTSPKLQWLASDEDLKFADNSKAIFGAGADLQIYHDASNSYISDVGTGKLILKSNGTATLIQDSAGGAQAEFHANNKTVKLFNNNSLKLATTATGIDVTGAITASGKSLFGNTSGIKGTTSDDTSNVSYFSFYKSNGTSRQGYVGFGSTGNQTLYINNDLDANIIFRVNGSNRITVSDTSTTVIGSISTGDITSSGTLTVNDFVKASGNNLKFSAGGSHIMNIDLNGKVYPQTDNAYDLGFSTSAARWRNLYLSGTITSGAINASGPVSITGNASYVGNFGYSTLVLQDASGYPGINFRHGNKNWLVRKRGDNDDLEFNYSSNAPGTGVGTYTQRLTIRDSGGVNFHGGSLETVGSIASGVITATGEGHTFYNSSNSIKFGRNANENIQIIVTDGANKIVATQDSDGDTGHDFILDRVFNASAGSSNFYIRNAGSNQLSIDKNANVTIAGNLTVQGTTTTIDTANLNVEDNNITLNYSTGDSSGSANGAGITIQDAVNSTTDAFMNWNATYDIFQFSHSATFGYTTIDPDLFLGTAGGFGNISDGSGWSARGLYIHGGATGDAAAIGHNGAGLYFGIQNNSTGNSMSTWLNVTPAKDATFSANVSVTGDLKMIGTDSYIWTPSTSDGFTGFYDPISGDIALRWQNDVRGWGIAGVPESGYKLKVHGDTRTTGAAIFGEQISIGTTDTSSGHVVDARESRNGNSLMRLWNTNTGSSAVSAIRAASNGTGAEARRFELTDAAGWLTTLASDNTNGFRLRHGSSASGGALVNAVRFGILNSGDAYFTEQLRIRASSYAPFSNLFEGTLVVEGGFGEDPIITKTDSGTAGAAAGVFHQSSASPTFPAFVVNTAASSGTNKLLSLRTGVSNSTGTGGTEKFSVDNDGRTWSRNTVVVGDVTSVNSGFVGADETDAFIIADGTKVRQYILTDSNDGGAWHQWVRYRNGVNTWRVGTYDGGFQTGASFWRLAGLNQLGGELNYIVAGPRAGNVSGTGWSNRTVIYEPYARYGSDTDYTGSGTLRKILSTNTTGESDITFQHTGTMDINLIGNPPELNFEDTSSTTGLKRARWTLDSDNFSAEGLSDNDGAVTQELLRFPLSNGNGIFGNDVFVEGGQVYLGKPDVASGHLNAYEAMTFNIDGDNDDADTRYFRWYKNGNSGGGNQLMALTEGGLLGIGTNPSSFRLHVEAVVGGNAFKVTRGAGTQFRLFQSGDGTTHMGTSGTNGHFIFRTGTTVGSDDERLRITKDGLVKQTIAGNVQDGSYYSGYTMNITGASTFGGMRFDRNGTPAYRVGMRNDDKFQIANFNLSSGVDDQFVIDSSGRVYIGQSSNNAGVNADNLIVGTAAGNNGLTILSGTGHGGTLAFADSTADEDGFISFNHPSQFMQFGTGSTERMRITSNGRVRINTQVGSSWDSLGTLVVKQVADGIGIGVVDDLSTNTFMMRNNGTYAEIHYNVNVPILFSQSGGERMRIHANGSDAQLALGTVSPQDVGSGYGAFTVGGSTGGGIIFASTGSGFAGTWANTNGYVMSAFGARHIEMKTNDQLRLRIDSDGNVNIGDYTSANVLKFRASQNSTSIIRFNDNNDTEGTYIKGVGVAGGGDIRLGARWNDDEDKIYIKLRQSSDGYSPDLSVGLGTDPKVWSNSYTSVQFGTAGSLFAQNGDSSTWLTSNVYINSSGNFARIQTDFAGTYDISNGTHRWGVQGSGNANSTFTLYRAMYLDNAGKLLLGPNTTGVGISGGDFRAVSKIDLHDTTTGAFRIYNGSTFRGGLGTGQWASGDTANVNKMALYSAHDIQFYNNNASAPSAHFTLAKLIKTRASEATTGQLELRNEGGITNGNFDGIYFTQGSAGATPLASIRCAYLSNGYPELKFYTRSGSAQESERLVIRNDGKVELTKQLQVGTFANSQNNTGEAWIGRSTDREDGTLTVQLGGNSASNTFFEIVDRAWTKVMYRFAGDAPQNSMYVTSAGRTGLGLGSPQSRLHITETGGNAYSSTITRGSNHKGLTITQQSNGDDMTGIYFATGGSGQGSHWSGITGSRSANAAHWGTQLNFYTHANDVANLNDATQKMVIKGDGKVGINNNSPTYMLDVKGLATEAEPYATIRAQAATQFGGFLADAPTQSHIRFAIGGNVKWQWRTGTNVSGDLRAYSWDGSGDVFQLTTAGYLTLSNGITLGGRLQMSGDKQIFTYSSTVVFEHDTNNTPVAFQMNKGGNYAGTTRSFGVLNLSRTNGSIANGNGSSMFFMLKADGGSLVEYAGITGVRETNTTGSLDFHSYNRNVQMRMDNSGNLTCAGNVTAYSDPSDRKLKENIENIPDAVEKVKALNGVTFNYKKDGNRSTGLIAQEVQEVLPEAVYESKDLDGNEFLALNYGNTVGLLVEAIKEQQSEIDALKKIIEEMKNVNHQD